jgi:hypothetical protein
VVFLAVPLNRSSPFVTRPDRSRRNEPHRKEEGVNKLQQDFVDRQLGAAVTTLAILGAILLILGWYRWAT